MKNSGYRTGGKHPGRGTSEFESGKKTMVNHAAANHGNHQGPNTVYKTGPGGYGSTGKKSDSSPSK